MAFCPSTGGSGKSELSVPALGEQALRIASVPWPCLEHDALPHGGVAMKKKQSCCTTCTHAARGVYGTAKYRF
eukprot:COSAG02_NODE_45874_length_353_cov_1.011811_2_plen_73_part_01